MPSRSCDLCNRLVTVPSEKWKLINYDGTFVCSAKCTHQWIESQPLCPALPVWSDRCQMLDPPSHLSFKSNFENKFSLWLDSFSYPWMYEAVGFEVGETKTYTPDFLLTDRWCFLETKGRWGLGQKHKMEQFREQYPTVSILVVPWIIQSGFNLIRLLDRKVA